MAARADTGAAPPVSIGMPVYNGAKWLVATVESILSQRYVDFELVISDNASTDATEKMCRQIAAGDQRVRYFRNDTNVGASNNFNLAFKRSRGAFFKWTSCSDLIAPDYLSKCVPVLSKNPDAVLVFPRTSLFTHTLADGQAYAERFDLDVADPVERFRRYTDHANLNNIMQGLIRSSVLRGTQLYRKFVGADFNMIAELILRGRAIQIDEVLHYRRMEEETFTARYSAVELRRTYDPANPNRMVLQFWRRSLDYFPLVLRAPLPVVEKLELLDYLLRRTWWNREALGQELRLHFAGKFKIFG
jgi:glycosyltransferase involved in cell wall biosynthesis